ncbi:MAG: undecaprenyl-diphosphate phosphatase [Sandaracinaceae bacterium]
MSDPIDAATAAALGAVQGATEFLPVSSSGHVALGAMLFGVSEEMPLSMVVLLHFGTLIATAVVFRADLAKLTMSTASGLKDPKAYAASDEGKTVLGVLLASVPTAIIGLGLEPYAEAISHIPWAIGIGLLGSAVMVTLTRNRSGQDLVLSYGRALAVGVAQGIAVWPGLSRSGTTIAVAMLLGMSAPAAFRFSFLLSLPAILGATLLSLRHTDELRELGVSALIGAAVATVVGTLALLWLRHLVTQGRLWLFAFYLVPVALLTFAWPYFSGGAP